MDIRENGANGVSVVRLANKEYLPENANAIHQLHSMVENNVMEIQTNSSLQQKCSMPKSC